MSWWKTVTLSSWWGDSKISHQSVLSPLIPREAHSRAAQTVRPRPSQDLCRGFPQKVFWQQWPLVAFRLSCLAVWHFGGCKTHSSASKRQQFTKGTLLSPYWSWVTQGTSFFRKFLRPVETAQGKRACTCSHPWGPSCWCPAQINGSSPLG